MKTNWLRAGHKPQTPRRSSAPSVIARHIVASIQAHATEGIVRQPTDYTQRAETLAAVDALLAKEARHAS